MLFRKKKKNVAPAKREGDVRAGNFIIHLEDFHIKFADVAGMCSVRIPLNILSGTMLKMVADGVRQGEEEKVAFAQSYGAVLWNLITVVPDAKLLKDVDAATRRCINRHKDLYAKEGVTEKEDKAIIREEREFQEEVQMLSDDEKKE